MLNWGDKDAADKFAAQLKELLRDRTMTCDQLGSVYSIKHKQSVVQKLKEMSRSGRTLTMGDFVAQMPDFFEVPAKNQVRARGVAPAAKASSPVAARAAEPSSPAAGGSPTAASNAPAQPAPAVEVPASPARTGASDGQPVVMKYADVSRSVQNILKEQHEPITIEELDQMFKEKYGMTVSDIVGMSTPEYLQRKENIFDYEPGRGTVFLNSAVISGPPMANPATVKDEVFVVKEFEQLIEAMGPVVYISTLCGKFIQRNGMSVSSIISTRPLDLFKRHPGVFLIVGQGNVTLKKYERIPDVQRLIDKPCSKAQRIVKAAEDAALPLPVTVGEQHVVEEFRRLILADGVDSVYISSLCGRFLQRFKQPVSSIITCKPAEFLRRYPEIFVMTGGGNVGLREILGPDAVSVPPPPPRVPRTAREEQAVSGEAIQQIKLTDQVYYDIHSHLNRQHSFQATLQRLTHVCKQIEQASFLALDEVVLGGAAGKGLLADCGVAEVVMFVKQLPYRNFPQWLPHIMDTLRPVLEYQLESVRAERFKVEKDHLRFVLPGGGTSANGAALQEVRVDVYLTPVFKSREHLMECIKASPPAERSYFRPALVKERNEFTGRQPAKLKLMIRLMSWWCSKQTWSTPLSTPWEWLIELIVVHVLQRAAIGSGRDEEPTPQCLSDMVTRVLEAFANFGTLKIAWDDYPGIAYAPGDVPGALRECEPLILDPSTPYVNLADASVFDCRELVAAAQAPGAFNSFKAEASKWLGPSLGDDASHGESGADEDCEEDDEDDVFEDAREG